MAFRPLITTLLGLDGAPESGGLLQSYVRSTTTPLPLYADVGGTTPRTNPIVAESLGQIVCYFNDALEYSWQAKTADGSVVLWEADVVAGVLTLTFVNPDYTVFPLVDILAVRAVNTYADLTALLPSSGLIAGAMLYTKNRSTTGDGGFGEWEVIVGTALTENGGTVLTHDSLSYQFQRKYNKGRPQAAWFGITVGDDTAAAANAAAINAAMLQCSVDGGGVVEIPPTLSGADIAINAPLDNCYDNVIVRGAGASDIHDAPGSQPGTALKCTAAITALKMRSPYGGSNARKACMGFDKLTVVGVQTRVLEIDSIRRGYVDIAFSGCAGTEAVLVKNGVSFSDLAESADTQRFDFFRVRGYLGPTSADGVVLTGASNANTSLIKQGMIIDIVHYNGHQLRIKNADNIIAEIMGFRLPAGTGQPYYCHGTNAGASTFTSDIEIRGFGGGYIEGTEVAGTTIPAQVLQHGLDITNSATMPTLGTGARVWLQDNFGRIYYLESVAPAYFGSSFTEGEQARSAAGANTPMTFRSNSQDGLRFTDGLRTFTLRINSSGYVELVQLAGSTGINITGNMQLNGLAVSVGANDSGGAGFRLLRIPN